MNDELLFGRMASHDGPAAPDIAFEDRLYLILQGEMRRGRSLRPALLLAATLILVFTITAAIAVGSGLIKLPRVDRLLIPDPSPTSTIVPIPSPMSTIAAPAQLTWTKVAVDERSLAQLDPGSVDSEFRTTGVAWLGDRFVLVDALRGGKAVSTSSDGRAWELLDEGAPGWDSYSLLSTSSAIATWGHDTVLWTTGVYTSDLRILRPPDEPVTKSDFSGGVGSVGIGPSGIVAHVHSALDFDAFVTSKLGPGWVEHMVSFSYQDGILRITTDDDRSLEIVWADAGFAPGDVADRGFGWYSPDGDQWTPIPGFPANVSEIVGASDGFFARGGATRCDGCRDTSDGFGMWHSPDGLSWRKIDPAAESWAEGTVLPWGQGVLVTDGTGRFDVWTADGRSELPMAAELPPGWTASNASFGSVSFGSGPFGLVSVNVSAHEVLFTPNGVDWSVQAMSAEMASIAALSRTVYSGNIAVGKDSVVVLLWAGGRESGMPSLWVGTLQP
jgi:hypothetical protein